MDEIALAGPARSSTSASPRTERNEAFTALVDRHAPFLYRVAFGLLRNRQDAEDAVQETLLKLFRGEAWTAMDEERAFLARAVWRVGLDRLGTAAAKAMRHAEDVTNMNIVSEEPTPEDAVIEQDARQLMRRLVDGLPENFRQVLVLSAIEGMSGHAVAAVLGIPEATVRTRVLRAKAELRERFKATLGNPREVRP